MSKRSAYNEKGFTLIEIAMVMVIIGLLAGGGVSLMGILSERRMRNDTSEYLDEAKSSLINFAKINGRLPWADGDGDGDEDTGTSRGTFPFQTLNLRPSDSNRRVILYEHNNNLGTDRSTSCSSIRGGLSGSPLVVDSDGSSTAFPLAAILVSAGPQDADGDGNVFDDINTGTFQGDNRDGIPNYLRSPPTDVFDDLVVYLSEYTLYGEICGDPVFAVNNQDSINVFVFNSTQGSDIGIVPPGIAVSYRIISGDQIELWTAAGGTGLSVTSVPGNPVIVSGSGIAVEVP